MVLPDRKDRYRMVAASRHAALVGFALAVCLALPWVAASSPAAIAPDAIRHLDMIGGATNALATASDGIIVGVGSRLALLSISQSGSLVMRGYSVRLPGVVRDVTVVEPWAIAIVDGAGICVVDIADAAAMGLVMCRRDIVAPVSVASDGEALYVASDGQGVLRFDLGESGEMSLAGQLPIDQRLVDLVADSGRLYVAAVDRREVGRVHILTDGRIGAIAALGVYTTGAGTGGMVAQRDHLYVGHAAGVSVVDVADAARPASRGVVEYPRDKVRYAMGLALAGTTLVSTFGSSGAVGQSGYALLSVTPDGTLSESRLFELGQSLSAVVAVGDHTACMCDEKGAIYCVELASGSDPQVADHLDFLGTVRGIGQGGDFLAVTDGYGSARVFSSAAAALEGRVDRIDLGVCNFRGCAWDVAGWRGFLYVLNSIKGVSVYDVRIEGASQFVEDWWPKDFYLHGEIAYRIAFSGDYGYLATGKGGLVVVRIGEDGRLALQEIKLFDDWIFDVEVRDGYLLVSAGKQGVRVYEGASAGALVEVASIDVDGSAVKVRFSGRVAFCLRADGDVVVVDLNIMTAPEARGLIRGDGPSYGIEVADHGLFMLGGDRGMRVLDVSDIDNVGSALDVSVPGGAWDIEVVDHRAYVASVIGGLNVYDVHDLTQATQAVFLPLVDRPQQHSHAATTMTRSAVSSRKAITWSRLPLGKPFWKPSIDSPASR